MEKLQVLIVLVVHTGCVTKGRRVFVSTDTDGATYTGKGLNDGRFQIANGSPFEEYVIRPDNAVLVDPHFQTDFSRGVFWRCQLLGGRVHC